MTDKNQEVNAEQLLGFIDDTLSDSGVLQSETTAAGTLRVKIPTAGLVEVCSSLRDTAPYYFLHLSRINGRETGCQESEVELTYHLYSFNLDRRLQLSVGVDRGSSLPSLRKLWTGAGWPEWDCSRRYDLDLEKAVSSDEKTAEAKKLQTKAPGGPVKPNYSEISRYLEAGDRS